MNLHKNDDKTYIRDLITTEIRDLNKEMHILYSDVSIAEAHNYLRALSEEKDFSALKSQMIGFSRASSDSSAKFSAKQLSIKAKPLLSYYFDEDGLEIRVNPEGKKLMSKGYSAPELLEYFSPFMGYLEDIENASSKPCFVVGLCEFKPMSPNSGLLIPQTYYHVVSRGKDGVHGAVFKQSEGRVGKKLSEIVKSYQSYSL